MGLTMGMTRKRGGGLHLFFFSSFFFWMGGEAGGGRNMALGEEERVGRFGEGRGKKKGRWNLQA